MNIQEKIEIEQMSKLRGEVVSMLDVKGENVGYGVVVEGPYLTYNDTLYRVIILTNREESCKRGSPFEDEYLVNLEDTDARFACLWAEIPVSWNSMLTLDLRLESTAFAHLLELRMEYQKGHLFLGFVSPSKAKQRAKQREGLLKHLIETVTSVADLKRSQFDRTVN